MIVVEGAENPKLFPASLQPRKPVLIGCQTCESFDFGLVQLQDRWRRRPSILVSVRWLLNHRFNSGLLTSVPSPAPHRRDLPRLDACGYAKIPDSVITLRGLNEALREITHGPTS